MCSAYTEHGARSTLEALARGASDYVMKPSGAEVILLRRCCRFRSSCCREIAALAKDANGRREELVRAAD